MKCARKFTWKSRHHHNKNMTGFQENYSLWCLKCLDSTSTSFGKLLIRNCVNRLKLVPHVDTGGQKEKAMLDT